MPRIASTSSGELPITGSGTRTRLPAAVGAPCPNDTSSSSLPDSARIVAVVARLKGSSGCSWSLTGTMDSDVLGFRTPSA
jgi:hypothetical protein